MKIVSLIAENVKKLVAVQIQPDGNLVQITGKNGQGKTSVLDAIWWALAGTANVQSAPIRRGATEARIALDLGEIKVTRTFKEKDGSHTTSIVVETAEGARFPSPQKVLDSLFGELTFDPLAFARMKPKEQFDALRRFVPDVDFDGIDAANKADFDKRTGINREAQQLTAAAERIVLPPVVPTAPVDEAAMIAELEAAGQANLERERREQRRQEASAEALRLRNSVGAHEERIAQLQAEIEAQRVYIAGALHRASELEEKLTAAEPLPEPIDTQKIREAIAAARDMNAVFQRAQERRSLLERAQAAKAEADRLTAAMTERSNAKQAAIAAASLPVPGLGFGNGEILLAGVPFEQASDAEKLRASVAIAMASNPKLRVIRIRDGSLLDEDAMRLLGEMADTADMQIWVERVDSSGKVGFVLEDGHVKTETDAAAA